MFYLRLLHIPRMDWALTTPGQLFDLVACYQIMHGAQPKEAADDIDFWDYVREVD